MTADTGRGGRGGGEARRLLCCGNDRKIANNRRTLVERTGASIENNGNQAMSNLFYVTLSLVNVPSSLIPEKHVLFKIYIASTFLLLLYTLVDHSSRPVSV